MAGVVLSSSPKIGEAGKGVQNNTPPLTPPNLGGEVERFPENLKPLLQSGKIARIQVKNRIDIGDKLRMISPTQSVEFKLEKIYSLTGEELQSAHGGSVDVYISIPEPTTEYAIIRTQEDLNSPEKASKLHKEIKIGTKENPVAKIDISLSPAGYSWLEKKKHAITQSLRFF